MKAQIKIISLNILLICSLKLYSKAIVCVDDRMLDCVEIANVSFDGGVTWQEACCRHLFNLQLNGFTCEDNCFEALNGSSSSRSNSTDRLINEIPIEGIEYKIYDENLKEGIIYTLEFIGERIYLNGQIIARVKENINVVEVQLPRTEKVIRLKSVLPDSNKFNALLQAASIIVPPIEILLSPNPNNGKELNIDINKKVQKILIYNMQGQIVYTHSSMFEGSCVLTLPNLKAGAYIVEHYQTDKLI